MNNFRIGQKVVCVDDTMRVSWRKSGWFERWRSWTKIGHNLNRGDIYTITSFQVFHDRVTAAEVVCVLVAEAWHFDAQNTGFPTDQFRPLVTRKTDIDIFQKMLTPNDLMTA